MRPHPLDRVSNAHLPTSRRPPLSRSHPVGGLPAILTLGLLVLAGCEANPEGPRVSPEYQADARIPAWDRPPLPKTGGDNPRRIQFATPD